MPISRTLPSLARSLAIAPTIRAGCNRRRHTVVTSVTAMQAVLAAAFLMLSPLVQAQAEPQSQPQPALQEQEPAYGLSGRIGLSVATVPTYEGSPNRRTLAVPDLSLSYRSHDWGTVEFDQRGLFWNAVETGLFRFSLVAQFDPGRRDRDTATLNPTPGDQRLAGMGNVRSSIEAGAGVGYGPVMLVARQSLGQRGSRGTQVDMSVGMPWALSDRLGLHFAVVATWADRDYMQSYFGVTAAQAQATSFSVYTPKAGCRKVEASVSAEYAVAPSWKLQANASFSQLGDEAAASPLVGRRHGASAALALAYEF